MRKVCGASSRRDVLHASLTEWGALVLWSPVAFIWSAILIVLLPQSCESLLLRNRIDIGTDEESYDIEEWDPSVLRQEFLSECQTERRSYPADLHD